MKCPNCGRDMEVQHKDTSHNSNTGKHYERTQYVCETCDVWITAETPQP